MIVPEHEIRRELEPGETMLWTGAPDPRKAATIIKPLLLASLVGAAIILIQLLQFNGHMSSLGMTYFICGFIVFEIIFMTVGVPYWFAQYLKKIAYAVTDRRIIVVVGGPNRTVRSFTEINIDDVKAMQRPDGSGDLVFARPTQVDAQTLPILRITRFMAIPDVRDVERLVQKTFSRTRV